MCLIVQERLVKVIEKRQLLVEEQGGFRRGRGCRDQILSLSLLGQTMLAKGGKGYWLHLLISRRHMIGLTEATMELPGRSWFKRKNGGLSQSSLQGVQM